VKGLLTLLTVCVVLAILQAIVAALVLGLGVLLLVAFITRPRETIAYLASLLLFGLASTRPGAFIALTVVSVVALVAAEFRRKAFPMPRLGPPR